jgi:lysophospholipase L1-like esterase
MDASSSSAAGDAARADASHDAASARDAGSTPGDSGGQALDAAAAQDATSIADASTRDSGSQGGDAATTSFEPCPTDGGVCKILPLGDSITYGIDYAGAYRVELFHDALMDHKNITFVGDKSLDDGPAMVDGVAFPQDNQGHSGWTIAQIDGLIPSPALDQNPHIILLHIGTNDMYTTTNPVAQAPQRLGTLIDHIVAAAPNALLVVAQITPLQNATWEQQVQTYNAAVPGVVQMRASAGKHVLLVDMHTGFQVSTMLTLSDGIHPNQTGYNWMGDKWYGVIKSYLP